MSKESSEKHLGNVALAEFGMPTTNPWTDARKTMSKSYGYDEFVQAVSLSRFFYRTEPLASTVLNKLVEFGINDLVFSKNGLTENEFRLFGAIKPRLLEFAEQMALEFLLSGLVVPEVGYKKVTDKNLIFSMGVKKYSSIVIPDSLTIRDPKTIKIYSYWLNDQPAYFVKIPDDVFVFVKNKGKFADGKEDKTLYDNLKKFYPDFVKAIERGEKEIQLENPLIIRRKYLSDAPYPIPFIAPALDALQHKRKLRRVDYSIMDKVISAILLARVGNDQYPITDSPEDQAVLEDLASKLRMRGNNEQLSERIFQLVTNHTVDLKWIFPDSSILLDTKKYDDINQEILFALGFPRVLITGESLRSGTSNPEIASLSPVNTMTNFREKIIQVIRYICNEVAIRNGFKSAPQVSFATINLYRFSEFVQSLSKLYDISAISRTDFAKQLGFDFIDQLDKLEFETTELQKRNVPLYGLNPYSAPTSVNPTPDTQNEQGGGINDTQK